MTYAELEKIEGEQQKRSDNPSHLRLDEIRVAEPVFQWRVADYNLKADEDHARELLKALRDTRAPFDPLVLVAIGQAFYIVDGHHRYQAYQAAGWAGDRMVPVRVMPWTLREAQVKALEANSRNKLAMSTPEKTEAAWRLVKMGTEAFSRRQIVELAVVSQGTVATMRRRLREMYDAGHDEEAIAGTPWAAVKHGLTHDAEWDREGWREKEVAELAEKLLKALKPSIWRRTDILADALERMSPRLPRHLVEHWGEVAREVAEGMGEPLDI